MDMTLSAEDTKAKIIRAPGYPVTLMRLERAHYKVHHKVAGWNHGRDRCHDKATLGRAGSVLAVVCGLLELFLDMLVRQYEGNGVDS